MKQILFFILFTAIVLSPLSSLNATVKIDINPNMGSDLKTILPGPITGVFDLLEGLKSDIEAKMTQIEPKISQSGIEVKNIIQGNTGQSIQDILGRGQEFIKEKVSFFNSDLFISQATEFIRKTLMWLIETVQKGVNYL